MPRRMSFVDDDEPIQGFSSHSVLPWLYDSEGEKSVLNEIAARGYCSADRIVRVPASPNVSNLEPLCA
jgi:hypothetical protein